MKINSISLNEFRGFEKREFLFNPKFNVLIGENGSGKTSILEALAIAINSYVSVIEGGNVRPIRREDVRVISYEKSIEPKLNTALSVEGMIQNQKISWSISKPYRKWGYMRMNDKAIKDIAKSNLLIISENGGKEITLPVFDYLGCGRLWTESTEKVKTFPKGSRLEGYHHCLSSKASFKRFTEWFKTMELSLLQGNESAKQRAQVIKRAVTNCLEGWDTIHYDIEQDMLMAIRGEKGNVQLLPFSYLSDGQRNIIGIVADIAYRCIILNPFLEMKATETPGIVLIDELDLHLHPKWQKTIVKKLKQTFPNIQFITTSHSPFIIQSLSNEELIDLEGKNIAEDYRKMGIEEIAESEMGVKEANRSERFLEMKKVADEYYQLILKGTKTNNKAEIDSIKEKLERLLIPFYDDPAYVTYLESFRQQLTKS